MDNRTMILVVGGLIALVFLSWIHKKEKNLLIVLCDLPFFLVTAFIAFKGWQLPDKDKQFTGLAIICGLIAIFLFCTIMGAVFRSRCPKCKKLFAAKFLGEDILQSGETYTKKGKYDELETWQNNIYGKNYECKHCQHQWTKKVKRPEKV